METGNPKLMRKLNKSVILETIRKKGPMSRAQLTKYLGLSFPAISNSVNVLLEDGWIVETEKADSNEVGRKATLLEYNGKKGYVVGIDIGRTHISGLVCDIAGKELLEKTVPVLDDDGKKTLAMVKTLLWELISSERLSGKMMCISVGIPGYYQEQSHRVILAPFIKGWEEIDIKKVFQEEFQVEVLIDNSVNLGAIAEKWKRTEKKCKNLFYMDFGIGIGSAMILNGELYRGFNGVAGEIGHYIPDYTYSRDHFDDMGILEKVLYDISGKKEKGLYDIKATFDCAERGDAEAIASLDIIKKEVNVMLSNYVSLLNPEYVIFAGKFGRALFERFAGDFTDYLKKHVLYLPIMEHSSLGNKASVNGAVAVALRNVHSGYSLEKI